MIELTTKHYTKAADFFNEQTPNLPVVMAVIEQNNPGKIWMDEIENPTVCLVISNGGYSFIGTKHKLDDVIILSIIDILKKNKPIKLAWKENNTDFSLFEKAGFTIIDRLHFYHPAVNKNDLHLIDSICNRLSNDLEVKPINAQLLAKSNWLSFIKLIYGSADNFLKNGFGLALIKNDEILSEAFACYIGAGLVETGSVTAEKHCGKGYATLIRAYLIKEIISRGLKPATSCNADNFGSAKASKKLGYEEEFHYYFLAL